MKTVIGPWAGSKWAALSIAWLSRDRAGSGELSPACVVGRALGAEEDTGSFAAGARGQRVAAGARSDGRTHLKRPYVRYRAISGIIPAELVSKRVSPRCAGGDGRAIVISFQIAFQQLA